MRLPTSRLLLTATASSLLLFGTIACGDDPDDADGDTRPDFWECDEFVDGADLNIDRFNQQTVVLNDEHVLIMGGSEWLGDGGARRTDTWEVFNVEEDAVEVEAEPLDPVRRNPSLIQRDDGSVIAVGGVDDSGDQKRSAAHFSANRLEWSDLPDMNAAYSQAGGVDDDRIVALGVTNDPDPAQVLGQVMDINDLQWSSVSTGTLFHDRAADYTFESLGGDELLFVYAHPAPQSAQLPADENPEELTVHEITAVVYDIETGDTEELTTFDEQAVAFEHQLVELEDSGQLLLHLHTMEYDLDEFEIVDNETVAYLFDPDTREFTEQYRRESHPGTVLEVLPGDQVVYDDGPPVHIHEVPGDGWYDFQQIPDGVYYSTMNMLEDWRLFAVGERSFDGHDRRDVQTGYCVPVADED